MILPYRAAIFLPQVDKDLRAALLLDSANRGLNICRLLTVVVSEVREETFLPMSERPGVPGVTLAAGARLVSRLLGRRWYRKWVAARTGRSRWQR